MERRIEKKCEQYICQLKLEIDLWFKQNKCNIVDEDSNIQTAKFIQHIYDYDNISFTTDDFQKRKRAKHVVDNYERCQAKRASGEQCTRRKKKGLHLCGTHFKGLPNGVINEKEEEPTTKKVEIWVQCIKGINYYIDANNNVYKPDDILRNIVNPRVIAKYELNKNEYSIPEFNI